MFDFCIKQKLLLVAFEFKLLGLNLNLESLRLRIGTVILRRKITLESAKLIVNMT